MSYSLLKSYRLRKHADFQRLRFGSTRILGICLHIDHKPNGSSITRLGISVSRRFGNAAERNRFKRLVREAFRLKREVLPSGIDLNVKPRGSAKKALLQDIMNDLTQAASK